MASPWALISRKRLWAVTQGSDSAQPTATRPSSTIRTVVPGSGEGGSRARPATRKASTPAPQAAHRNSRHQTVARSRTPTASRTSSKTAG
ncbi:hypothetical protein R1T08_15405 [Streptomyces sp. SBC-4]|nr:hypothetical protein [Streptomyces sp. SBC-4]MDV5145559.1 hypothetical protein [Streptomyces sp. SBC-4]